jgi:Phage integrase family
LSSLFTWAAYPRQGYVTANPCATLEPLEKEPGRDRPMTTDEIKAFWHLLDSDQLGGLSLHVRLLFKFALATGRRTDEVRALHVTEIVDLDGENPHMIIPAKRVKNGKPVVMALSTLAVEIIKTALTDDGQQFVFKSPIHADKPVHRNAMNAALRGNNRGRKSVWEAMGFTRNADGKFDDDVFKPHDFRHTAATLLGGFMDSDISIALGHTFKGERVPGVRTAGPRAPAVTLGFIHIAIGCRKSGGSWMHGQTSCGGSSVPSRKNPSSASRRDQEKAARKGGSFTSRGRSATRSLGPRTKIGGLSRWASPSETCRSFPSAKASSDQPGQLPAPAFH